MVTEHERRLLFGHFLYLFFLSHIYLYNVAFLLFIILYVLP